MTVNINTNKETRIEKERHRLLRLTTKTLCAEIKNWYETHPCRTPKEKALRAKALRYHRYILECPEWGNDVNDEARLYFADSLARQKQKVGVI